ncbi:hypothetical protein SAMN02910411_2001 [Pseudobutyrivibrio ruminis DSM 9787]|uniref:Uncharacterized protein n=1 Tax=Pseudobutyrivibrio ruminis DSM 9787 TaxID=1123011 RepID=A0A285S9V4_9FIRM|nr:hypothetical protein SAMN02910411_2001 [Pseudobutyrivibrio ruminis DSM 9787]
MGFRSTLINTGKLILKCTLVTAPLWGFPIFCANNILAYAGSDYVGAIWINDLTQTKQSKYYSTLVIGDSTANSAYLPEVLSDDTVNLALAGSSPVDGYYTLENYLNNNKAPKDIFVSYMDYHLDDDSFTWNVSNYIHKFTLEQNEEIYKAIEKYSDLSVAALTTDNDYETEVKKYLYYSPQIYSYSVFQAIDGKRYKSNTAAYEDVNIRLGRYCQITNNQYEPEGIMGYSTFNVSPLQEYYYKRILNLCEKKHIAVHMVKLPLSTDAGFIDDYETEVTDYYDELLEDYDDADFYWFHTTYEHEFFSDAYHMNNHGSFRFSRELLEQYPDVFEDSVDDYSRARMLAIDADIAGENYMGELTKRIDNKPFTLIFLDSTGNLSDFYYMSVGYNDKDVQWLDVEDNNSYALWFLSGDGAAFPDNIQVTTSDNSVAVTIGEEVTYLTPADGPGIRFCVIDNKNKSIVCTRQSVWDVEKGFRDIY